jgi:NAD(P)-dependent dehydrogenase (short-subunit alcohol dehydrogenase family)
MDDQALSGKVVLITGATSGVGEASARGLVALGATVVAVARNAERANSSRQRLQALPGGGRVSFVTADLASQAEVRALAEQVEEGFGRLDVLVNNAGVDVGKRITTRDGLELTFAVNYLAPFLLTHLLLPKLKASAPSRVLNVASSAHRGGQIDFDDLQCAKRFGQRAYNNSKLALVLFTYELARRLRGTGVTANCVDPGFVRTGLGATMPLGYRLVGAAMLPLMATAEKGAQTTLWAASSPELADVSGAYFKRGRRIDTGSKTHDLDTAKRLWAVSDALVEQ